MTKNEAAVDENGSQSNSDSDVDCYLSASASQHLLVQGGSACEHTDYSSSSSHIVVTLPEHDIYGDSIRDMFPLKNKRQENQIVKEGEANALLKFKVKVLFKKVFII